MDADVGGRATRSPAPDGAVRVARCVLASPCAPVPRGRVADCPRSRRAAPSGPGTRRGSPTNWGGREPLADADLGGPGPLDHWHPTIRTRHPGRTGVITRRGGAAPGPGGCRGRGGRDRSGRPARRWSSRGRCGRRAPGARRAGMPVAPLVDQGPGQLVEQRLGRSRPRSIAALPLSDGAPGQVLGAEQLAPERGTGWPRAGRGPRSGGPGRPIRRSTHHVVESSSPKNSSPSCQSPPWPQRSFPATLTRPGTRTWTSSRGMNGSVAGLPEQHAHQAGRLLALGAARGAAHVRDQVAGGGAARRPSPPPSPPSRRRRRGARGPGRGGPPPAAPGRRRRVRPMERHSTAIWSMTAARGRVRAAWTGRVEVGMGRRWTGRAFPRSLPPA